MKTPVPDCARLVLVKPMLTARNNPTIVITKLVARLLTMTSLSSKRDWQDGAKHFREEGG